jgi:Leucine-rich repeat (LRR) protein
LSVLDHLYLHHNQLTSIPESIIYLTNLMYLPLYGNPLSAITLSVTPVRLPTLHILHVFLKCYFALALKCSFPVIEALIINYKN